MSPRNSEVQCVYCLASNSVPPTNAKCCCASCGRIFEIAKSSSGTKWAASNATLPEPPIIATSTLVNYRSTPNVPPQVAAAPVNAAPVVATPKIAAWPWPGLASRSEEGRQKFFSIAFRHLLLISVPIFALMSTLAIGYEVGMLSLLIIIPLAFVSALAMGVGQTWIVDNFYQEGKTFWQVWWIPGYMHFYILTRWAICWRPLGMIALGGAFHVLLLLYLMGDQLGTSAPNKSNPTLANQAISQQAKPFDSRVRSSPARRSATSSNARSETVAESLNSTDQSQPANETVWSYESLAASSNVTLPQDVASQVNIKKVESASQPVLSPVFEEDDGFREWSNLTGSHKVVAKFDVVDGDFVRLKSRDGRKIRVEISKLSAEDRRFLEPILQSSPFEVVGGR